MGISSDGILVFGFVLGEEGETPVFLDGAEDMDEFIGGEWDHATHDARKAKIDACPADLTWYCSYEYPMYILSIRGTGHTANRGDAVEITQEMLTVSPERIAEFKAWCEDHGIAYEEPKWLLCSMYG